MQRPTHPGTDLIVAALVAAAAAALFVGAAKLPPPRWEPLGSAAVPRALGTLLALFAGILAVGAVRALAARVPAAPFTPDAQRMLRGVGVLVSVIVFVVAMDVPRVPFVYAGPVFVVVISALVGVGTLRGLGWSAVWGVALCSGIYFAFTSFFYINLP